MSDTTTITETIAPAIAKTRQTSTESRVRAEKLADIFTSMQRSFILRLSKELGRGQVTFPQYLLLGYLSQGPLTMTEIAEKMGHTTAATTGLIDRLERLSLAGRVKDTKDRRVFRVTISEGGVQLVNRVREDMVTNLIQMMGILTSEEEETWLRIYEKIMPLCK